MHSAIVAFLLLATLAIFTSAASSSTAASSSDTCENVLFVGSSGWWAAVGFRTAATPYNGNSQACGDYFTTGEPQCCDDSTYSSLDTAWTNARTDIENARNAIANSLPQWENAKQAFADNRGNVQDSLNNNPNLSDDQKQAILDAYDQTVEAYGNFLEHALQYYANCLESILKYFIGLVCLGCDPNAGRFLVTGSGISGTQLKLTVDTCNEMKNDCLPFWELVFNFVLQIFQINARLIAAFNPAAGSSSIGASVEFDFCDGGDCGAWICNSFYAGIDANTGATPLGPTAKRAEDAFSSLEANLKSRHESIDMSVLNTGREGVMTMVRALMDIHAQRSGSVSNTYSSGSDAYAPYSVAAKSNLATSVSDAGSDSAAGLTSWIF